MNELSPEILEALSKARESALHAVDSYNRTGTRFRSGAYIVLMVIAWTALFHAIFRKKGVSPAYPKGKSSVRYWELSTCLKQYYLGNNPPARKNLEFLVGLRNEIEHRSLPQLDDRIFGECQACLLNFESLIVQEFGEEHSLNESLAFSLQFSTITPEARAKAARELQTAGYQSVMEYVERFRSGLSADVYGSMEYSYKVFLLPKIGNHVNSSDMAVEFINVADLDEESKSRYESVVALLKTRETPVLNPGHLKPSEVARMVEERLGSDFKPYHHTLCWKHYGVRPLSDAKGDDRARCDAQYCQYDVPHGDYIYTHAWVDFLVSELSDAGKYEEVLRRPPQTGLPGQPGASNGQDGAAGTIAMAERSPA